MLDLISLLAFLVTGIGVCTSIWAYYVGLFSVTQWLTPANKAIVITGCDSGIGFQLARHFHQLGSLVISTVVSKESEGATQLLRELKGDRFHLVQMNLKSNDDIRQAVSTIEGILTQANLGLHALVNNAGVCVFGEFDFCTMDQINDQIDINLLGTIRLTKLILPLLIQSKGRIVNVSSVNAMQSFPGIAIYSATKRALEGFTDALRMELHKFKVQVISLRLGDYARLTSIMSKHEQVVVQQERQLDQSQRRQYGDYFDRFHKSALQNYGYFSPKSFESSTLFYDFEEAILAVEARTNRISATWSYKMLIYFLIFLPIGIRESLIRKFSNSMLPKTN